MTTNDFLKEVQALDPRFTFVPNPNRVGLTNIFFEGRNFDLPVISSNEVRDDIDHSYRYDFPNGMSIRHHSKVEVMTRLQDFIKNLDEERKLHE